MLGLMELKNRSEHFINNHKKLLLCLLIFVGFLYIYMWRIPLPSDDEMVTTFRAHRPDIEELVSRYRAFETGASQSHDRWITQGDTPAVMKRAGVRSVSETTLGLWFPDPYAPEHDKRLQSLIGPESMRLNHKIGVLRMSLSDQRYRQVALRHGGVIWKDFLFFPEVPRIEKGRLIGPDYYSRPTYRLLVLSSLDERPLAWLWASTDQCVLRQFEPNWFIRLCRG